MCPAPRSHCQLGIEHNATYKSFVPMGKIDTHSVFASHKKLD